MEAKNTAMIENKWKQLSMRPLSDAVFRFASEVAIEQRTETLKAVGNWLDKRGMVGQDGSYPHFVRVEIAEIEAFRRGEMPESGERC